MKQRVIKKPLEQGNSQAYVCGGEHLTIPGQVYSLREIRDRFQRGQSVEVFAGGYDETIPPGIENLDKLEKIDLKRNVAKSINSMQKVLQERKLREQQEQQEENKKQTEE